MTILCDSYMYAGAAHADMGEYRECVRLWNYALSLKITKVEIILTALIIILMLQETLLSSDTSFTVRAVIQLYMNILLRQTETGRREAELQFSDVLTTTRSVLALNNVCLFLIFYLNKFLYK